MCLNDLWPCLQMKKVKITAFAYFFFFFCLDFYFICYCKAFFLFSPIAFVDDMFVYNKCVYESIIIIIWVWMFGLFIKDHDLNLNDIIWRQFACIIFSLFLLLFSLSSNNYSRPTLSIAKWKRNQKITYWGEKSLYFSLNIKWHFCGALVKRQQQR